MRTIKFRGLRTDGKGWVYGGYQPFVGETDMRVFFDTSDKRNHKYEKININIHLISEPIMPDEQGWDYGSQIRFIEVTPDSICQFTGLTDKNGKEIYEGDILGDWVDVDGKMEQSRQTVFLHEQEAQWMLDNSHKQDQSHFFSLAGELKDFEYEIIGNIHENPELLNPS